MVWETLMPRNAHQSHSTRPYSEGHVKPLDRNTQQMFSGYLFTPPDKHTSSHYHHTIFDTSHMVRKGELGQLLPYKKTIF